jgi:hypothetical protein
LQALVEGGGWVGLPALIEAWALGGEEVKFMKFTISRTIRELPDERQRDES